MSRLSRAICLLAAAAFVAGCGSSASADRPASPRTGGTGPGAAGAVAHSISAVVSELARSRGLPASSAPVAPVAAPRPAVAVSAPAPAAAITAPTAAGNPIVALGDSLTFGWGRGASPVPFGPAPVHSYPWYVEHDLGVPVVNAGISGTTAREVLDPASEPNHPRPPSLQLPALLALHPRLMIVSFGSNEVQRGWPVWQSEADLDRVLARISAAGVPMVLMGTHIDCSVSPCPQPEAGYVRQRYLSNWDAALTQLATRYQAGLVLDVERGFTSDDLTDWIHPTAIGYWRIAQRIETVAVAVLQRQAQRSPSARPAPHLPGGGDWGPPPGRPPEDPGQRDPRPQSDMWPGGPHEYLPWNLQRVLSLLGHLGVTAPPDVVMPPSPEDALG